MPLMSGLQATKAILAEHPSVKVLVLTAHEDQCYFQEMCRANVSGYVVKRTAGASFIGSIRQVASGQFHFDQDLASAALASRPGGHAAQSFASAPHCSGREEEIVRGTAWGHSNKELAETLGISVKTVETHKMRVCQKFGFRTRVDLVRYAVLQGWLNEPHQSGQGSPLLCSRSH